MKRSGKGFARIISALALGLGLTLALGSAAQAATFTVNDGGDTHDASPGNGTCADSQGHCTLRAAIEEGNNLAGDHVIVVAVPLVTVGAFGDLPDLRAKYAISGPGSVIDGQYQQGVSPGYGCISLIDSGTAALGHGSGADGSSITGLTIVRCNGAGIATNGHGYTFANNFIGITPAGTAAPNSGAGIDLTASAVYPDTNTLSTIYNALPVQPVDMSKITGFNSALATAWSSITAPITIAGNVISGNGADGIQIHGSNLSAVMVSNNFIGTDPTGGAAVPNGGHGVHINATSYGNMIGPGNVISGNAHDGLRDDAGEVPLPNFVMGNLIGLGLVAGNHVGNGDNGLYADTKPSTGSAPNTLPNPFGTPLVVGPLNLISDNRGMANNGTPTGWPDDPSFDVYAGVYLTGASSKIKVLGNTIGMAEFGGAASASTAYGNSGDGIVVTTSNHTIGGPGPTDANIIAGNTRHGIVVRGSSVLGNAIVGNQIGVHPGFPGALGLGNAYDGIVINAASVTAVGGGNAGEANGIAGNGRNGVALRNGGILNGWANLLQRNRIYGNAKQTAGVAIDLEHSLNAADDPGHAEFPPNYANGDQVPPVICLGPGDVGSCAGSAAAASSAGSTTLDWSLASHAGSFRAEFYSIDTADANSATRMTFLGEQTVTRDILGFASAGCSATRCSSTVAADTRGAGLLMTVTDITNADIPPVGDGPGVTDGPTGNTSEFSNVVSVPLPASSPPVMSPVPPQSAKVGVAFSLDLNAYVTPTDGDPILAYVLAAGALPANLLLNNPGLGFVSGTPTAAGVTSATINAQDKDGSSSAPPIAFTVAKGDQAISFGAAPSLALAPLTTGNVTASGGASGNAVTLASATPAICSISGSTVTPLALGTCTISANQPGNADYNAAPQQNLNITVQASLGTPPVMGNVPDQAATVGVWFSLTLSPYVTLTEGNPILGYDYSGTLSAGINFNAASGIVSGTPTAAGVGTIQVRARDVDGYSAYDSIQFTVAKGSQSISFGALANKSFGAPDFAVSASAGSGLAIGFASQTPGVCSVSGNLVHLATSGTCTVRASQSGDANWNAAAPVDRSFTVSAGAATHLAVSAPASVAAGAAFSLTVTALDAGNNVATGYVGTVHFVSSDGAATLPANYVFTAGDSGAHSFVNGVTLATLGNQTVSAVDTVTASVSGNSGTIAVGALPSTTVLASATNPSVVGQMVTLTATVTGSSGTPSGTVTFLDGASTLCPGVALNAGGQAQCSSASLGAAAHALSADYSGGGAYGASTGGLSQTVNPAATATSIGTHTPNPSAQGQPIAVSVAVSVNAPGAGTPTGTITVSDGTANCQITLPATSCNLTPSSAGAKTLTASYGGSVNFAASVSAGVGHTVTAALPTTYAGNTATGSGPATATVSGGGCGFAGAQFILAPAGAPAGVSFPHGLFDFTLGGCAPGATATVSITYPGAALPAGTLYWKYNGSPAQWYSIAANVAGNTVQFSVTDNGTGDDDPTPGVIHDPGGPGAPQAAAGSTPIPTLSEWGLLLLSLALGFSMLCCGRHVRTKR